MADVYSPPNEVFVLSYVWKKGNASGGQREVLLDINDVERRIKTLVDSGETSPNHNIQLQRLVGGEWSLVEIKWPVPLSVDLTGDDHG